MKKNTTLTIGMDIGDRKCHVVVLAGNDEGPTETTMIKTIRESMQVYFESKPISTVAIEVGTHSACRSRGQAPPDGTARSLGSLGSLGQVRPSRPIAAPYSPLLAHTRE